MGRTPWLVVGAATRTRTLVGVTTLLRLLITASLALAGNLIFVAGANGHASLLSSTPEDGATLDVAPEDVRFTFSEELFAELIEVSVLDSAGELVMATEAEQTPPPGTDVIVPWPTDLPPGEYSVAFRVVSADGHPVTGRITFSYESAAVVEEPTPELINESSAPASPTPEEATPETVTTPAPEKSPETTAATSTAAPGEPDSSLIGPLLIGAAIIVGIGVVFSIIMLARQRN